MRAGRLRHSIQIQRRVSDSPAQNAHGEEEYTYTTVVTTWASVEPLRGREYWAVKQTLADVTTRIRTRYESAVAAIDPTWRVLFGARVYDIESVVKPREIGAELEIMAVERV